MRAFAPAKVPSLLTVGIFISDVYKRQQVDSNVVLTASGKIVDFQTTSEGEPYEFERMIELFNTAKSGIDKIIKMY